MKHPNAYRVQDNHSERFELHTSEIDHPVHDCPKCGKHALVQTGIKFQCFWCGYSRDLSTLKRQHPASQSDSGFFLLCILAIVILSIAIL
ncbi:MAG: hypothetical protein AAF959_24335 [Cyanobacteria bacterium P01_D01_bin.56]